MKALWKIATWVGFPFFYLRELVFANLFIAFDILTPRMRSKGGFLELPLELSTSSGILLFSNLLSMTPGTLTIEVSEDRQTIWIHYFHFHDRETIIKDIMQMQRTVKRMTE